MAGIANQQQGVPNTSSDDLHLEPETSTTPPDASHDTGSSPRDLDSSNTAGDGDREATVSSQPNLGIPQNKPPVGWVEDDTSNDDDTESDSMNTSAGYFGDSSIYAFISIVRPTNGSSAGSPTTAATLKHCHVTSSPSSCVQQLDRARHGTADVNDCLALPQRYLADRLVDAYFLYVHSLLPFIHEPTFRAKYERTWRSGPDGIGNHHLSWLGVLNLIFAYGCEFVDLPPDRARTSALRFFSRAKTILFSEVFRSGSLETVQTLLLMSHYLQSTNELNKCWSVVGLCIRMA